MPWNAAPGRQVLTRWPFSHTNSTGLAAAGLFVYGPSGDVDPGGRVLSGDAGTVMDEIEISNQSVAARPIWVGSDIPSMVIGGEYRKILSGATAPLPGQFGQLVVYNPNANPVLWTLSANLGKLTTGAYGHPGHSPELAGAVVGVPNGTAQLDLTAPFALTITAIKLWAAVSPGSAAGTYLLTAKKNDSQNLLSAATFNLETLVAKTITSMTLTATGADLILAAGDEINLDAVSDNADLTDGDFFVLVEATRS